MAKRFLTALGLILLFMVVLALILFVAITIAGDDETALMVIILVALVVSFGGFVPYLNWAIKRAFTFHGEGQPVPLEELRAQIQAINEFDAPVMVEERKGKLVATWKYVDARWLELFAKAGLTKSYELQMKFDEKRHCVTMVDRTKEASWRVGMGGASVSGSTSQGVVMAYEVGKQWGIKENFAPGKIYDYRFVPSEIKLPILNSILRSGWDVQYGMW
ncbi:MAG: hypothetical protein GWN58_04915 [Anaerolineae bacterium]|nr:hypothetical protein [Anaerolineae bacterium]